MGALIKGFTFGNEKMVIINNIKNLFISTKLDSPATSCCIEAFAHQKAIEIKFIEVYWNDELMFKGRVDKQSYSYSNGGSVLKIEARTLGAALLDNEAEPSTLWGTNISSVFQRHIAPYGFNLYKAVGGGALDSFTINKGMSQWDVLVRVSKRLYNIRPYVIGEAVVLGKPAWKENFCFSNTRKGIKFTRLEHNFTPYV